MCLVAVCFKPLLSQGLLYERPHIVGFHPLDQKDFITPLQSSSPKILEVNSNLFSDTAVINFENRQITFMRTDELGFAVWAYHYGELNDYLLSRNTFLLRNKWHDHVSASLSGDKEEKPDEGLRLHLELPVHYPQWAQRILGTEPPSLSISGTLTMSIVYDDTRTQVGSIERSGGSFGFESESQFSITGSVGRLINMNITASSGDGFDFGDDPLKNFKIEYKESYSGELEDEIIQEVVAGYTGFDMPGTSLSGYSERHEGLFGVKVRSKLGPLMLTAIMSHAQGEVERISPERQRGEEFLRETDYVKNRFFFLDSVYRSYYNRRYNFTSPDPNTPEPPRVDSLQIFRRMSAFEKSGVNRDPNRIWFKARTTGQDHAEFELLRRDDHYYLDPSEGWIRFHDTVFISDNNLIAYSMTTTDGSITKGQLVPTNGSDTVNIYQFAVLKPGNMPDEAVNDSTYDLMWRNVYRIPLEKDLSNLRLEFLHVEPGTADTTRHVRGSNRFISDVLGVSENNQLKTQDKRIFDTDNGFLIIPPFDSTFHGNEPFANPELLELADTTIYRYSHTSSTFREYRPSFRIRTSGTVRGTSYMLGWGVMRGTVRVSGRGVVFEENLDYVVNYDMGTLDLISPRAINEENIEIEYQRESLFVPERKWFVGTRGEVQLPFISDRSFAAMNMLFQGSSSIQTPQLGSEPYGKMLLNFNTRLDFEPEWMTGLVNLLPFMNTTGKSSAQFDFETAYSSMEPNKHGSAYLDNFERIRRSYELSLHHRAWHPASFPFPDENILDRPPAWDFYWFTPIPHDDKHRVSRNSMWMEDPDRSGRTGADYVNVLRMHAMPAHPEPELTSRFENAYAAIMTPFHRSAMDLSKADYLEILLKPESNVSGNGKFTFQIGRLREDQVRQGGPPNQRADAEDPQRLGVYREELDLGLNGLIDSMEYYLIPNAHGTAWDTLFYGDTLLNDPSDPAGDNWKEYSDASTRNNYRFVNGTQNNGYMDTEDILNNGEFRIFEEESFYSYTIDLDDDRNPYIVQNTRLQPGSGWRLYRIPIKEVLPGIRDSVNSPSWRDADMVRLVWTDFDSRNLTRENQLVIGKLEVVGNEWEVISGGLADSEPVKKIEPSVINNQENETYRQSIDSMSFRPRTTREQGAELQQALRLNFSELLPGDTALVRKDISQMPQDISAYDSLSLYIHGDYYNAPYDNEVEFVFRFGTDDSTYYEYRSPVDPGWKKLTVNIKEIAELKLGEDFGANPINITSRDGTMRVVAPVNRRPNFANISYMAMGVVHVGQGMIPHEGEIWVTELKVSGARELRGWASRTSISTQWADFMNLSANMDYMNADFRRMVDTDIRPDDSRLSGSFNASANLDKFLPQQWGVSIPVGGAVSGSITRPQQQPGTDVFLMENNKPDGLSDMLGDAVNMMLGRDVMRTDSSMAKLYERQNVTKSAYASYSKTSRSSNPLVNITADRIGTEVRYNQTANWNARGENPDPDSLLFVVIDTSVSYTGKLTYDLSPRQSSGWSSWRPLENLSWVPGRMRSYQFNLFPRQLNFNLAELTYEKRRQIDTEQDFYPELTRNFTLRHGMNFAYSPISPLLSFDYRLNIFRDLTPDAGFSRGEFWGLMNNSVLQLKDDWDSRYLILHGEQRRDQEAKISFNPQIFDWLTHRFEYSANYNSNISSEGGTHAPDLYSQIVRSSLRLNSSLDFNSLFGRLGSATSETNLLNSLFESTAKGLNSIDLRSVSMTYETGTELRNNNFSSQFLEEAGIDGFDFFMYQLGLLDRSLSDLISGHIDDYRTLGGMHYRTPFEQTNALFRNDSRTGRTDTRFTTQFSIPGPVRIRVSNISLGWGKNFQVNPDTSYVDTTFTSPEIRVAANTPDLIKIGPVGDALQRANLSSNFRYRRNETVSSRRENLETTLVDFSPLVAFEGTFKRWPSLVFSFRQNYSVETKESHTTSTDIRRSGVFTLNYEFSQSSALQDIKLFNRVIPVRGRARVGLRISNESEELTVGEQDPIIRKRFSLEPEMSYVFTDNVTGRLRYSYQSSEREGTPSRTNVFALIVTVNL
ncbi:hypothetical protein CHISP_3344 [Chitinispirillum alkaliphilum]|nr:hypothetical protein CHISP_3344 [Chitinispirillum alkaliphilum]